MKNIQSGSVLFYIVILIVGALIGSVIGEVLGTYVKEGPVYNFFVKGIEFGLTQPVTLDLKIFSFTLGFTIKLNLASVIGFVIAALLLKKI
jgi:hypothetical protein